MLCWGDSRWGVRRLLTHIAALPRDSAYVRHLSGDSAYWDEQVEMTAKVLDAVRRNTYYLLRVNGNNLDEPEPIARPGKSAEPETVSLAQFNAFLRG